MSVTTLHPGSTVMTAKAPHPQADVQTIPVRIDSAATDSQTHQLACGNTLMSALHELGLVAAICGGQASCGTCRVTIDVGWSERLQAAGRTERRLLQSLDSVGPHDRLSCQLMLEPSLAGLAIKVPDDAW